MRPPAKTWHRAFTLVEVLVAMLVLTIMLLAVSQIVNSANKATGNSRKQINADSEARTVFDRIADDLGHMINRSDVDFALGRNNGGPNNGVNDTLFFYSEGSALADTAYPTPAQSTAALVGYRINSSYQLERLGKDMALGASPPDGMVYLTYSTPGQPAASMPTPNALSTFSGNSAWQTLIGSSPTYTGGTDPTYYHVLSQSVFRFEFCYLLKPVTQAGGTVASAVYSNYPNNLSNSTSTYTYATGLQQVQAIVVALAVLDPDSRKTISTSNLVTLTSALTDPTDPPKGTLGTSPPQLMAQVWDSEIAPGNFTGATKTAAANVRIYQRTFYLGPFLK